MTPYNQLRGQWTGNATWAASLRYNGSDMASPWDNAFLACSQSWICLMGFHESMQQSRVFIQSMWQSGAPDALEMLLRAAFDKISNKTRITPAIMEDVLSNFWLNTTEQKALTDATVNKVMSTNYFQCPPNQVRDRDRSSSCADVPLRSSAPHSHIRTSRSMRVRASVAVIKHHIPHALSACPFPTPPHALLWRRFSRARSRRRAPTVTRCCSPAKRGTSMTSMRAQPRSPRAATTRSRCWSGTSCGAWMPY